MEIHEYLTLDTGTGSISCRECGNHIANAEENYKKHCAMAIDLLTEIGPGFESPAELLDSDHDVQFRRFYCPNCAVLIDHEIARAEDPILHDIELDLHSL
ncbi:acetone carboxylase subunit gamma [Haladaptatus pallidirubidus]|uniref:Acetophenone carboxylase n=1 Tax=Haladaptatus pallidirubidus TaxID=1008152 RepID=A0AAV3UQX1_9EURY|nr:acetone carboxylase subunit gamma [Haladaptatus pallidirubidus]